MYGGRRSSFLTLCGYITCAAAKFKKEFRSVFRCSRPERNHLLHESTYGHGKFRVQQRTPITQSTELDHNGAHV